MKYKAVFFDLFGTLVRNFSYQDYHKVLVRMAEVMSISPEDFSRLWYETAKERNTGRLITIQSHIEYIGQKMGVSLGKSLIERAVKLRLDYVKSMLTPRPGAVEILKWLKAQGCKVGLISDCSIDIPLVWDETPLANLFDTVVFSCAVGLKKPDPRIYELALQKLGVKPEDSLFIGDGGSQELTGALNVGLLPVMIEPYGETELPQSNSEARTWEGPKILFLEEVQHLINNKESKIVDHFIDFKQYKPEYLEKIINRALAIKKNPEKFAQALTGKKMYMLFQKTSTRTSLSFAFGMNDLGGNYFLQKWDDSNFAVGELQDETRYVARSVDVIMARLKTNEDVNLMAKHSTAPVINGCCNKYHPCQAMADLLTVKEIFGHLKVKLMYIGVRNNVLNSLMDSLPRLGGELYAVTPIINEPSIDEELYQTAVKTGRFHDVGEGNPSVGELKKLVKEMDVIYTDTWIDMEFINDKKFEKLKNERIAKMLPFQINSELLKGCKAVIMHDMPIHAGYEISREAVEAHMDTILQQAENRKWAQEAILLTLLEDEKIRGLFK